MKHGLTKITALPNDGSDAPKIPSGKGKRLIVLHAGKRNEGLIDGCDLEFLAKSIRVITQRMVTITKR
jgi:hypothetical protein